jgi:hypothetical protein
MFSPPRKTIPALRDTDRSIPAGGSAHAGATPLTAHIRMAA